MITACIVGAAFIWLIFLVWYTVRAKWWRDPYGRNTFLVSLVVFWILLRLTMVRLIPGFREHEILGAIVYVFAALAGLARIALMERAQRETDRMDRDERSTE